MGDWESAGGEKKSRQRNRFAVAQSAKQHTHWRDNLILRTYTPRASPFFLFFPIAVDSPFSVFRLALGR